MARTTFLALLPLISLIPYLVTAANPLGSSFQAAVLINNTIYVHGGEGVSGTISNLYSLDTSQPWSTATPPWTDLTPNAGTFTVPQTSFHAMWPAADGKSFYIWGGGNDYYITQTQSDFAQYNVIAGTWSLPSAISGMPVQKRDLSVVWSSSGVAYLWGGLGDMYTGYTTSNSTKYIFPEMTTFDTTKLIWNVFNVTNTTGQVPPPRVAHTATMLSNGQMVIIGGLIGTQLNETSIYLQYAPMTNIPVFDTYTTTWTLHNATGNPPVMRRYGSAVLSSDGLSIIICCGGTQSSKIQLNDVAVLDSRTWAWTQPAISGTLPTPRLGHSAVLANGQIIVLFDATRFLARRRVPRLRGLRCSRWFISSRQYPINHPLPRSLANRRQPISPNV
ncbi:hypothetical protein BC936DRAFT_150167 [Jimgerdemannia flammicorona]|uniref:Galactose oxidase n=1 Tax=Jimgerdemannia flammicorona TaxID=994334 RepID=A0A433CZC5_9FUNG|nr:hypothetical protein BC936DRAFT_150167 [Jimgerdemannia flammicorona]